MNKYANLEDKTKKNREENKKVRKHDDTTRATKKQLSSNDPVEEILKEED